MTGQEWAQIVRRINANWPRSKWDADTDQLGWDLLNGFSAELVGDAVLRFLRHPFPPSPGELLSAIEVASREPEETFEECWFAISRQVESVGSYAHFTDDRRIPAYDLAARRLSDDALDLIDAMGGWDRLCLGGSPDGQNPIDPGVWHAEAEHAWSRIMARKRQYDDHLLSPTPLGEAARAFYAGRRTRRRMLEGPDAPSSLTRNLA